MDASARRFELTVGRGVSEVAGEGRPSPPPISFEEFLAWADEDTAAEWVDGEVVLLSPASLEHQDLLGFLYQLIRAFVEARALGSVYFAPVLMRLPTRPSGREPDLLFVSAAHADRLRGTYVDGPADLVLEIVSPDSDDRDRGEKFIEYEAAAIPEYWLVDPLRQQALFFHLGADSRYRLAPIDADGFYHSAVLAGFRLRVDWLWRRPLPRLAEAIRAIERPAP
jgi:Uma2 family endonuclease